MAQKRQAFYLSQPNASSMFDERQSLLLIDRYSYHSLRPCTALELASIGYKPDCALLELDLQPLLTTHHQQQVVTDLLTRRIKFEKSDKIYSVVFRFLKNYKKII